MQLMNLDLNRHFQNSIGDKAYKGEDLIDTPINKPRNGELTIEQKNEKKSFLPPEYSFNIRFVQSKYFELFKKGLG